MKRTHLSLLCMELVAVLFVACQKEKTPWTPNPKEEEEEETGQPGEYLLPLIETTDLHGYIISQSNGTVHYRMAYIADKVNDIRVLREEGLASGGHLHIDTATYFFYMK